MSVKLNVVDLNEKAKKAETEYSELQNLIEKEIDSFLLLDDPGLSFGETLARALWLGGYRKVE